MCILHIQYVQSVAYIKIRVYRLRKPNTQDVSAGAFQTVHHSTNQEAPLDGGDSR